VVPWFRGSILARGNVTRGGTEWTVERVGRLGFLIGIGYDSAELAEYFRTTQNNIFRQCSRFKLSLCGARNDAFNLAAKKRGIGRGALLDQLLLEIRMAPVLIDNILDDDVSRAA
jgi:hypothetical protein